VSREYSKDQAAALLKAAFAPLDCSVEIFDSGNKARFRVFAPDGSTPLNVDEVLMQRLQTAKGMASIVAKSRHYIEGKGFKVAEWQIPSTDHS
jgi:hypothetical protein